MAATWRGACVAVGDSALLRMLDGSERVVHVAPERYANRETARGRRGGGTSRTCSKRMAAQSASTDREHRDAHTWSTRDLTAPTAGVGSVRARQTGPAASRTVVAHGAHGAGCWTCIGSARCQRRHSSGCHTASPWRSSAAARTRRCSATCLSLSKAPSPSVTSNTPSAHGTARCAPAQAGPRRMVLCAHPCPRPPSRQTRRPS